MANFEETTRAEDLRKAEETNRREHELTIFQAIKLYPKAIGWSLAVSVATIMDGYDYHLLGGFYAQPAFQEAYGTLQPNGKYAISAPWQAGLNNGSAIGTFMGLYLAGTLTDTFGFRKTLIMAMMAIMCLIFIQFFAQSLVQLLIGQILMGFPLAVFQTVTVVYAVEVAPTCLRDFLTSFDLQMWTMGHLIATIVIRGCLDLSAPWAYRVPFAVQWFWPLPLIVVLLLAPEAPGWYVRKGRLEDARRSMKRLASGEFASDKYIDDALALLVLTTQHERKINSGTSYAACFRRTDLRRTLLVVGLFTVQILGGTTLRSYATFFFTQAGLATTWSFNMAIITYSLSVLGTIIAWFLMPYIKGRTLFLWGFTVITIIYFVIGCLGVPSHNKDLAWGIAACLVVNGFVAYLTMQPVIFALVPEIPSGLLRSKTVPVGRFLYGSINIAASILTSYQINSTAWGWGAKTGFFWGGLSLVGLVIAYYHLPAINDRTIAEIDLLFESKVSARDFGKVQVNVSDLVSEDHKSEVEPQVSAASSVAGADKKSATVVSQREMTP